MIRAALFLARKHLGYLARDRETLLWAFAMPPVFFYFIGTVTGGFSGGPSPLGGEKLYIDAAEEGDFLKAEVLRRAQEQGFDLVDLEAVGAEQDSVPLRRLEFPDGFTQQVLAGDSVATVRYLRKGAGNQVNYEVMRLTRAVYTLLADVAVLEQEASAVDPTTLAALSARERGLTLEVRPAGERKRIPNGFEQAVPGTMVMFTMSVILSGGAVMLVVERKRGLLRRMAAAPMSRGSVVLGKWLGNMALAIVQIAFAMLVGLLFFDVSWGGSRFPAVCLILVLWAALNAALALLLGNLARTEAQAGGIATFASLALAALGGCWWPIEIAPDAMVKLAGFLPTGWTMDAMHRLVSFGQPPSAVLGHACALAAATLVVGWAAARTFRYQ